MADGVWPAEGNPAFPIGLLLLETYLEHLPAADIVWRSFYQGVRGRPRHFAFTARSLLGT
ncbi:MAG TPA: hypothetical protein VKK81_03820 [Candidatus Binatia bacterium]|nr:hypothetical protein [Candidatus Binatia bacterium]